MKLVERLEGEFTMYGSQVGALKVFITVVEILGSHCLLGDQLSRYLEKRFNLVT